MSNSPDSAAAHNPAPSLPQVDPPTVLPTVLPTVSEQDIADLASAHSLLLALDVDGTLAEFSTDPLTVRLIPDATRALNLLRNMPNTTVMLLSGRDLAQLQIITEFNAIATPGPTDVRLVGSHGAEPAEHHSSSSSTSDLLSEDQLALLDQITAAAEEQATRDPGLWVEHKPFSRGFHRRGAVNHSVAEAATESFRQAVVDMPGVHLTDGKGILEVAVTDMTKGRYLHWFTSLAHPERVLFIGDDTTDETALMVLRPGDLGVKVGEGDTVASRRITDPRATADVLLRIAAARATALSKR